MPGFQYNYSPYEDAANAIGLISGAANQTMLGLAQLQYNQQVRNQADALARAKFALDVQQWRDQQPVLKARADEIKAQTDWYKNRGTIEQGKLDSANKLGVAFRGQAPQPDMMEGPTAENADMLAYGDFLENVARSTALSGKANTLLDGPKLSANQVQYNRFTGAPQYVGPQVLSQGTMGQIPGQQPVTNPKPLLVPPDYLAFMPSADGSPATQIAKGGPKTFNPASNGSRSSAVDARLIEALTLGDIYDPTGRTNAPSYMPLAYQGATNALARAASQSYQQPQVQPQQAAAIDPEIQEALTAIQRGKDPDAVRQRYFQRTGKQPTF